MDAEGGEAAGVPARAVVEPRKTTHAMVGDRVVGTGASWG